MRPLTLAIVITIAVLTLCYWTAHAQAPRFQIQCVMLAGCWYHPLHPATGNPYPAEFWMWTAPYITLQPHQFDRVWNVSDWRWMEVTL